MHRYEIRLRIRRNLPWFLINLGIAGKGKDCESRGAAHKWYNKGNKMSACYYCKVVKEGELWKKKEK